MAEGAREKRLAHAGRAHEDHVLAPLEKAEAQEVADAIAVEGDGGIPIEVLEGLLLLELGALHQAAYTSIDATDELVAALFSGYPNGEERHPTRLHFFDWRGNFVAEVALPMPAYRIALSRDGGRVYAAVRDPVPRIAELVLDIDSVETDASGQN